MLPLILRLSQLDADAAGALRVVSFFDALVARRASLEAVVRSTAGLAECPAGLRDDATGRVLRHGPRGIVPETAPGRVVEQEVLLDDVRVGTVWLERPDTPGPLDAMVLERMALAAATLWPDTSPVGLSDPALVELAMSDTTADADRARALRLLGFVPGVSARALAVRGDAAQTDAADLVRRWTDRPGRPVRAALIADGEVAVILQDEREAVGEFAVPEGIRVGIGSRVSTAELGRSWQQARTALRFAGVLGRPRAVAHGELGVLAALAAVPATTVDEDPDVRLLRRLATDPGGRRDLAVLEAYLATGSQRHAATTLHRHHSSVSRRLEALSSGWGLDLERPQDRMRAETAFLLYAVFGDGR